MDFSPPSQLSSPRETETDFLVGGQYTTDLMNASGLHIADPEMNVMNPHPRRVSTLAYHSSPLRDPREKTGGRQSRWLIVVIPPTSLIQDHGPLGHTLTSGPTQRLSQGIVMPLQPTMYGQLTAIAREFNFPSPVGLCLYLQITEPGVSMTPRISDDIWPALWGHLFEPRSPVPGFQTPICGRVEFDIDRRKARWLNSWLTSDRRHAVDVPVSVPPSLSHGRQDSKNSFFDERGDERPEISSALHIGPRSRHIPKKLSLVDRLGTHSRTSSAANAITGSGTLHAQSNSLATVLDDEIKPKIALEKRVESWRASSSVAPTPMATTDQVSLDPEHVPNNIQLSDLDILVDTEEDINLNDFAWSASSMGPPEYVSLASAVSGSQVPSVHLDRRLEGSVLLTPSTATSWGPQTLDNSPMSVRFHLPSPDIGQRVIEDCPPTPSVATSWGPEELLYSPESVRFHVRSPDLGQRMLEDCPPTPTTAASWGREELSRSALSEVSCLPSLNLAMNMFSIWPFTPSISTCRPPTAKSRTSGTIFPYLSAPSRPTWTFVWPLYNAENVSNPLPLQFPEQSLADEAYNTASLHFKIFPAQISAAEESDAPIRFGPFALGTSTSLYGSYPTLAIYPLVYPHCLPPADSDPLVYPHCLPPADSDPLVYPHYLPPADSDPLVYPYFTPSADFGMKQDIEPHELYNRREPGTQDPAGYPTQLKYIYPPVQVVQSRSATSLPVRLSPTYPSIELYPPQYPFISPYRRNVVTHSSEVDQTLGKTSDAPLYPAFDIYPAVAKPSKAGISLRLPRVYPRIILYPAVYPELDLYPPVFADETGGIPKTELTPRSSRIRPANYPCFEIYPGHVSSGENAVTIPPVARLLQSIYPQLDIYPAVYPHLNIYRVRSLKMEDSRVSLSVMLPTQHPAIDPYPAVYPHLDIYRVRSTKMEIPRVSLSAMLPTQYPAIDPYPAVYPHIDIYRVRSTKMEIPPVSLSVMLPTQYPAIDPYPAVYPHLNIYRIHSHKMEDSRVSLSVMLPTHYPAVDPYPASYPHFEIFPPMMPKHSTHVNERISSSKHGFVDKAVTLSPIPFSKRARKTHRELHKEAFAPVKVFVEQALNKPLRGIQARRPTISRTANVRQATSPPSSSLPPVPPLPMSKRSSLRMPSHNAEARHGGMSTPPSEVSNVLTDRPNSSHITRNSLSLSTRPEESIARSNSLTSLNSTSRRDHGHSKQSHRPRDSLILEKARHFDHQTLPHDGRPSSDPPRLSVPPVPQVLFNIPHLQTLKHTNHPSA